MRALRGGGGGGASSRSWLVKRRRLMVRSSWGFRWLRCTLCTLPAAGAGQGRRPGLCARGLWCVPQPEGGLSAMQTACGRRTEKACPDSSNHAATLPLLQHHDAACAL